jgi:hypothetical protein
MSWARPGRFDLAPLITSWYVANTSQPYLEAYSLSSRICISEFWSAVLTRVYMEAIMCAPRCQILGTIGEHRRAENSPN